MNLKDWKNLDIKKIKSKSTGKFTQKAKTASGKPTSGAKTFTKIRKSN